MACLKIKKEGCGSFCKLSFLETDADQGGRGLVAGENSLPVAPNLSALTIHAPHEGFSPSCWATAGTEQEFFPGPHAPLLGQQTEGALSARLGQERLMEQVQVG